MSEKPYKWTISGTARGGQTWSATGTIECEFADVFDLATREAFLQTTQGKAVFGKPGVGCQGPYDVLRVAIEQVAPMSERISNSKEIKAYMHCALCVDEFKAGKAPGKSPATYARLSVGWTPAGLQVWCERHGVNVLHVDFEGHTHPANLSRRSDS